MTQRAAAEASSAHVLICDDESRLASLTADLLEDHGFRLITCGAGDEALAAVQDPSRTVSVLLLDVNLAQGMSAEELLRGLHECGSEVRVVLTSGLAEEDVPEDLLGDPLVAGYLPKPYTIEALVEIVREAAGRG